MLRLSGPFNGRLPLRLIALLTLLIVAACGDSTTEPDRSVARVVVTPEALALVVGDDRAYAARAFDASGREVTGRAVTWSSSDVDVATISAAGLVTALRPGTSEIKASIDGRIGSGTLQVTLAPVATVTIDPAQGALVEGETRQYSAIAKDAAGRVLEGRPVTWSSGNINVATVSATGMVTALAAGTSAIRASIEGVLIESVVTVSVAAVASVEVSLPTLSLEEGESRQVAAVARDAAGRVLQGRAFTWSSANQAVATVDGAGHITAVALGTTRVTVTTGGTSADVQLTVRPAAVASVIVQPRTPVLELGESRQMTVIVKDARGRILEGRTTQWSVVGGTATITPGGLLTGVRNGYATINATVDGVTDGAAGTITLDDTFDWDLLYHRESLGARELYTYSFGTGQPPVRINAGTVSSTPTGSPDGARIAFAVSMTELGTGAQLDDIFAVDRTGLNMRRLTTAPGPDNSPAWSPVAARIAYIHWEPNVRADVWVMNADGSQPINLTGDLPRGVAPSVPAWSPDGSRLAFVESTSDAAGTTTRIWTMRADGTDKRVVTTTLTGFDSSPSWSADGTRLSFLRHYLGETDITLVAATGGVTTRIPIPGNQWNPAWAPDGSVIAFSQSLGLSSHLYTVRSDGTALRLRTLDPTWGGAIAPRWIRRR